MSGRTIPPGVGKVGRERLATMNGARSTANGAANGRLEERLLQAVDDRTWQLLEHRRRARRPKDRGWLVRRLLLVGGPPRPFARLLALVGVSKNCRASTRGLTSGSCIRVVAGLDRGRQALRPVRRGRVAGGSFDARRPGPRLPSRHGRCFPLALVAGYSNRGGSALLGLRNRVRNDRACRCPRGSRRTLAYVQNAVIVGAGDIGQLVARKLLQHPEYGINLVGFVDSEPKERQADLRRRDAPGGAGRAGRHRPAARVSSASSSRSRGMSRRRRCRSSAPSGISESRSTSCRGCSRSSGRTPRSTLLEAMPLLGLPPARLWPLVDAAQARDRHRRRGRSCLIVTAPLFAFFAWRIKRDSPGPVFFRQTRLGMNQRSSPR